MRQFLFLILIAFSLPIYAQYAGNANDWVEYNQTYYKYSITQDGIYRLTKSDLISSGIAEGEMVGANFKMIRNGEEIPLYVSTNGAFGASDFIEFLGKKNGGEADTGLYPSADQQPGLDKSLFTDASIHFLTIDNTGNHLRFTAINNDLTNLPAKEDYYMAEYIESTGTYTLGAFRVLSGINVYESTFDPTEGYNFTLNAGAAKTFALPIDNVFQTNDATVKVDYKIASIKNYATSNTASNISIKLGSSSAETVSIPGSAEYAVLQNTFPTSSINSSTNLVFTNTSTLPIFIPEKKITYPRAFDFTNKSFGYVNVGKAGSIYMEFYNLPTSSGSIIVYDLSSNERISEGTVSQTPIRTSTNSTSNNLVYTTQPLSPSFDGNTQFENFVAQQYDYIVIYHPDMETPVGGENYVQKFVDHKGSEIGGNWSVEKVNILQVYDQYAYGIAGHSGAIKNLIAELKQNNKLPKFVVLLGKGYQYSDTFPVNKSFSNNYVPTFGTPGSDNLMFSDYGSSDLLCTIGRVSARDVNELKNYVDKVVHYQTMMAQTDDVHQTKDKLWMKRAIHTGGADANISQENTFEYALNLYKSKFESTQYGGSVYSYFANSDDPIPNEDVVPISQKIEEGAAIINYFGHSAINATDFTFFDFSVFNQEGKYPFMLTNGCHSGSLFQSGRSLSEDFVLAENAGTLSFMGSTQYGISGGMQVFNSRMYDYFSVNNYGISLGEAFKLSQNASSNDYTNTLTKQQLVYHGDPSLTVYTHEKPDYLITEEDLVIESNEITAADNKIIVKATVSNIGKAVNEPVKVTVTRTYPNGDTETKTITVDHVYYQETIDFEFDTNPHLSDGMNQFSVAIDVENELDEITRANNSITTSLNKPVVLDIVKPIHPAEFGITDNASVELIAYSTIFRETAINFEFEIDTTENFNSNIKIQETLPSKGGSIKWTPNMAYQNETVYYWRVKKEGEDNWSNSSFAFLNDYSEGWNQSHYFQFLKDSYDKMQLNDNRDFALSKNSITVNVRTAYAASVTDYVIPFNQMRYSADGFLKGKIRIIRNMGVAIMDEEDGAFLENQSPGLYQSTFNAGSKYTFYYNTNNSTERDKLYNLFDQIEDGKYVILFSLFNNFPVTQNWANDSNSLVDKFEELGATKIRDLQDKTPYVFIFQKGNPSFAVTEEIGNGVPSILDVNAELPINFGKSSLTTPLIGPAANWNTFLWDWDNSIDNDATGDNISYSIIGVTDNGSETILASDLQANSYDLSSVNATAYPYMKIKVDFEDETNFTIAQLQQLRVIYQNLPDLAIDATQIAQSIGGNTQRTASQNTYDFNLENISSKDMTPVLVDYNYVQDLNNQTTQNQRYDALPAGSIQNISYGLDATNTYNKLIIEANPNEDQPEQYQFNNSIMIELSAILPVKYLYFTAEGVNNNTSLLKWGTASEINNSHFEIEHSTDGVNFSKIGEVRGAGNSNETLHYLFTHDTPSVGENFYRINQVDFDGTAEFTDIEIVEFTSSMKAIFPNPATTSFKISVGNENTNYKSLKVIDSNGRVVIEQPNYRALEAINISNIPNGVYVVTLETDTGKINTYKLVKN